MEAKPKTPKQVPAQHQNRQPGKETKMHPRPVYDDEKPGCGKLKNKVAVITGGDSGIGRAVAISFAKEGADVVIAYLDEHEDAKETAAVVEKYGRKALLVATDVRKEDNCKKIVDRAIKAFGGIDIVVNNAAVQYPQESIENITSKQLTDTFQVNIFSQFYIVKYALPHLKKGSSIINTASITAYRGHETLLDYSATKGAIVSFTRSLSQMLAEKQIRVNGVAPGPVWTPLIPSSFSAKVVAKFGKNTTIGRVAQPFEIAPCYVFLASDDAVFITGQVLHPNGGTVLNT
jgi:NAD(P)-dependent dehydrogenase (short-subunit alcohol dehydrogenase family)